MLVIDGFFDNSNRFIPDSPITIPQNKKVVVTIEEENAMLEKQITVFAEARKMLDDSADEILPDDFPHKVKWFRPTEQQPFKNGKMRSILQDLFNNQPGC